MVSLLKFVLSDFWIFVGFVAIISLVFDFLFKIYNRSLRHWNIRKHGYPPSHCDADGDFINTES